MSSKKRTWTDEELINAFNESENLRQIITKLNLAIAGGTYTHIKTHLKRLNLEFSTTWQERRDKGILSHKYSTHYNDDEIFVENTKVSNTTVRNRYELLHKQQCSRCGVEEWLGNKIRMDLDHINGNRKDNRIENLRWMCPNCHRQTQTWGKTSK
jgi:ribosomal protein S27AE